MEHYLPYIFSLVAILLTAYGLIRGNMKDERKEQSDITSLTVEVRVMNKNLTELIQDNKSLRGDFAGIDKRVSLQSSEIARLAERLLAVEQQLGGK